MGGGGGKGGGKSREPQQVYTPPPDNSAALAAEAEAKRAKERQAAIDAAHEIRKANVSASGRQSTILAGDDTKPSKNLLGS